MLWQHIQQAAPGCSPFAATAAAAVAGRHQTRCAALSRPQQCPSPCCSTAVPGAAPPPCVAAAAAATTTESFGVDASGGGGGISSSRRSSVRRTRRRPTAQQQQQLIQQEQQELLQQQQQQEQQDEEQQRHVEEAVLEFELEHIDAAAERQQLQLLQQELDELQQQQQLTQPQEPLKQQQPRRPPPPSVGQQQGTVLPPPQHVQQAGAADAQLKPALMMLLQQMQQAHMGVAQRSSSSSLAPHAQPPAQGWSSSHAGVTRRRRRPQQQEEQQQQQNQPQQQQQWQYRQQGGADRQTPVAQLTRVLQRVDSPQQLLQLLLAGGDDLNAVHLTAAVATLLQLASQRQAMSQQPGYKRKVKVAFNRLVKLTGGCLLQLDHLGLAFAMRSFAKLGQLDHSLRAHGLWGDLLHVSTPMLEGSGQPGQGLNPIQLSMMVYAVAQADGWAHSKPSRRWWAAFFTASRAVMQQQHLQQQQQRGLGSSSSSSRRRSSSSSSSSSSSVSQEQASEFDTGSSSSSLAGAWFPAAADDDDGRPPPRHQQQQQQQRGVRASDEQGFTPQGFANVVWALGKLQRRPGLEWAASLYAASLPLLPGFSPQGLANLALGLTNMAQAGGVPRPGREWVAAFVAAAEASADGFSSQGLANLLWSLAKLGYRPSPATLELFAGASARLLGQASAQDLSLLAYSFAVLGFKPSEAWWAAYWGASCSSMDQASSQALANSFWALGRLKKVPPRQWLLPFLACMDGCLHESSPQALSNVLWAAARLQLQQLPGNWLDSLLARLYQVMPDASALELGVTLGALKALGHRPSSKWMGRYFGCSLSKLPSYSPHQLANSLAALATLAPERAPPPAWSRAVLHRVECEVVRMTGPCLCDVMWGLLELRIQPPQALSAKFLAATAERMHAMSGGHLARTLRSLTAFSARPNAAWLSLLAEESHYHLSDLTPEQLADLTWAFAQLGHHPGPAWTRAVLSLVAGQQVAGQQVAGQQELGRFSARALTRLLRGLAGLRVRPDSAWLGCVAAQLAARLPELTGQELLQCVAALDVLGLAPAAVLVAQLMAGGLATPADGEALAAATHALAAASVGAGGDAAAVPSGLSPPQQQQQQLAMKVGSSSSSSRSNGAGRTVGSNGASAAPAAAPKLAAAGSSNPGGGAISVPQLLPRPQLPRGRVVQRLAVEP